MNSATSQQRPFQRIWMPLAALLLVVLVYVFDVGIDGEARRFQIITASTGNSDLYPRWLGVRLLLDERQSPYTAAATDLIERGFYAADYATPRNAHDQQFAYPVYVTFLIYPIVHLPFDVAVWVWTLLFLILAPVSVYVWTGLLGWPRSFSARLAIALLALGFIGVTNGFFLHQISAALLPLLTLVYWALRRNYYLLAGSALALFLVKPQVAVLLVPGLLLWTLLGWRDPLRRRLLLGFALTLMIMEVGAEILLPGWIGNFIAAAKEYSQYAGGDSLITALTGNSVAGIIADVLLISITTMLWWLNRRATPSDYGFLYSLCFTLLATQLIIPTFALYNQAMLVLPIIVFWLAQMRARWRGWQRSVGAVLLLLIAWNWMAEAAFALLYLSGFAFDFVAHYSYLARLTALFMPMIATFALITIAPHSSLASIATPATERGET